MKSSTEIIDLANKRYEKLKRNGFDCRSFYSGFIEGYFSYNDEKDEGDTDVEPSNT